MRLLALLLPVLAALLPAAPAAAADAGLQARLDRALTAAGGASGALVVDLASGEVVAARRADVSRVPASIEKLYTTASALLALGPDATLSTEVLGEREPDPLGTLRGDLYLRGGGDPTLGAPQVAWLARMVATGSGLELVTGSVRGDESLFDARRGGPSSGLGFSPDIGRELSALSYRSGPRSPARAAAAALTLALRAAGVTVRGPAGVGTAPLDASLLAEVPSPPLSALAALVNRPSDNFMAETLVKLLGAQLGERGSTREGLDVVRATLAELGVRPRLADGSGLSRANRTTPRQVVRLLEAVAAGPVGDALRRSLPVAGRSGTLARRMRRTAAQGRCAAKTGTLRSISALAGYCRTRGGARVAFALLFNAVDVTAARRAQDRVAIALAGS